MNEIVNKFLSVGEKFMSKMHLRQPEFMCSACGAFKNKEKIQKFKETGDSRYIYQNELDKACFNITWLMEILGISLEEQIPIKYYVTKQLILLKNDPYQRRIASMVFIFLISLHVVLLKVKFCQISNQQKNYTSQLLENLKKVR